MDQALYLGLDIGGTKCAAMLGDGENRITHRRAFPSGLDIEPNELMDGLYRAIDACLSNADLTAKDIRAIGISCGGPLDSRRGTIEAPPNLPRLRHTPIVDLLEARYGVPAYLQNDANACALAEWRFGAGRGCESMVFLTFGTGMGAGLILDGRLYCGASDMAGEVGHVRLAEDGPIGYGKRGSFEGFCSGGGIARLAEKAARDALSRGEKPLYCPDARGLDAITAKGVVEAADKGDPLALRVLEKSAAYLGRGLAMLIDVLNPQRIVIGSVYARAERYFRNRALDVIRREALPLAASACEIVPAQLGDAVGDVACLCVAAEGAREGREKSEKM